MPFSLLPLRLTHSLLAQAPILGLYHHDGPEQVCRGYPCPCPPRGLLSCSSSMFRFELSWPASLCNQRTEKTPACSDLRGFQTYAGFPVQIHWLIFSICFLLLGDCLFVCTSYLSK